MRLGRDFFLREVLEVAPDLLGKVVVRKTTNGEVIKWAITEVEAYRGEEDLACHAARGRTGRTNVMYEAGGKIYVYLIYGVYWLLNVVTGKADEPAAVLIRGVEGISGPGRVGRRLQLDASFYGEDVAISERLWFEEGKGIKGSVKASRRIGVEYAGEWAEKLWRFELERRGY